MKTGRFFSLLILMTVLQFMTAESSRAAFGFGGDDLGKAALISIRGTIFILSRQLPDGLYLLHGLMIRATC